MEALRKGSIVPLKCVELLTTFCNKHLLNSFKACGVVILLNALRTTPGALWETPVDRGLPLKIGILFDIHLLWDPVLQQYKSSQVVLMFPTVYFPGPCIVYVLSGPLPKKRSRQVKAGFITSLAF